MHARPAPTVGERAGSWGVSSPISTTDLALAALRGAVDDVAHISPPEAKALLELIAELEAQAHRTHELAHALGLPPLGEDFAACLSAVNALVSRLARGQNKLEDIYDHALAHGPDDELDRLYLAARHALEGEAPK